MATIPPQQQQELLVIDRQEAQGAILIRPTGEVDLSTVPMLWANLNALLEDGQDVIVDLNGIRYIDSSGLEALLDSCQVFRQRGQRFTLVRPASVIGRLIDIRSLDKAIPVFESIEAALDSFRGAHAYPTQSGQARHRAQPVRWSTNAQIPL